MRASSVVLICPACQDGRDWTADLDRCPACRSTALVRALGQTTCRTCGCDVDDGAATATTTAEPGTSSLSREVSDALERMFRDPSSPT